MNKQLSLLEAFNLIKCNCNQNYPDFKKQAKVVETVLERLEEHENNCQELYYKEKSEKQDEVLRIIKEKRVDVWLLQSVILNNDKYENREFALYNELIEQERRQLTQAEFDLLKEWLK